MHEVRNYHTYINIQARRRIIPSNKQISLFSPLVTMLRSANYKKYKVQNTCYSQQAHRLVLAHSSDGQSPKLWLINLRWGLNRISRLCWPCAMVTGLMQQTTQFPTATHSCSLLWAIASFALPVSESMLEFQHRKNTVHYRAKYTPYNIQKTLS